MQYFICDNEAKGLPMNKEQLYYIVEVSKTNSISKAAENLQMSQPGLSQAINSIEDDLGFKLFIRSNAGTIVTSEGNKIIESAKNIIREYEKMETSVVKLSSARREVFKVAIANEISLPFLETFLEAQESCPDFNVELIQTTPGLVNDGIKRKEYDVGFIAYSHSAYSYLQDLEVNNFLSGQTNFYTTSNHYFCEMKEPITAELLSEQEFVMYNDDQVIYELEKFQKEIGSVSIPLYTDNLLVIYKFLQKFQGVTLLRDVQLRNSIYTELKDKFYKIPLNMSEFGEFRFAWITHPDTELTILEQKFIQRVTSSFL